jgi:hypothetical protein
VLGDPIVSLGSGLEIAERQNASRRELDLDAAPIVAAELLRIGDYASRDHVTPLDARVGPA